MREVTATVLENKEIANEIYSLTFSAGEVIPVRAGQFCMVGIPPHPLRRPIAICKAEGEKFTVCYRLKGEGTRALAKGCKAGTTLSVLLPLGNGFTPGEKEKRIALVGGGVGIFPLISALREFEGKKETYAYMGFRNKDAICMEEELRRADKLVIATDDKSVGFQGTSVEAFHSDDVRFDAVLACGPTPMLRALKKATADWKIPVYASLEERMGCGIGACLVCTCEKADGSRARVCKDGPVFPLSEIKL